MSATPEAILELSLIERARLALVRAFDRAVDEHRQNGLPLVLWRDGKVVHVSPDELTEPGLDLDETNS